MAFVFDPAVYPRLEDVDVRGKAVVVRVDYNVAMDQGRIVDDHRLRASLPTLRWLLERGARVVLLTHLGRPQGMVVPELSTAPLARALEGLLGQPVGHVPDCVGRGAEQAVAELEPGQVLMLENVRFHLGEQLNQQPFVAKLARLGEVFVNEAFPALHRAHASLSGLAAALPVSVLGMQVQTELAWLNRLTQAPPAPRVMLLGGTRIGPKLDLLYRLIGKVEQLLVGGVVGHTLMAARDMNMGLSVYEPAYVEAARDILAEAGVRGCRILLPGDVQVARRDRPDVVARVRTAGKLGSDEVAVDIGPQTLEMWKTAIARAGTLCWLGSMGQMEYPAFTEGSVGLAEAVAASPAFSVVGGDTLVSVLQKHPVARELRLTTGNGVMMAALAGTPLPALQVLAARKTGGWNSERRGGSVTAA